MKFRSYAATVVALAIAVVGLTIAPANAVALGPVTNLAVSQLQVGQGLQLTATWTASADTTRYRAYLTDDSGDPLGVFKDTASTTAVLSTGSLSDGVDYQVAVKPIAPTTGAVELVPFTAITLDTTAPTGTYKVDRTKGYLALDFDSRDMEPLNRFTTTVTQLSQADLPVAGPVTRTIQAGDGSPATTWTTGTFVLMFHKAGTFTPKVRLTDKFGNLATISLSPVTVLEDRSEPRVRVTIPANPTKVASWRRVTGTATDTGTGVNGAMAFVLQKRGSLWYTYDFRKKKWIKGYSTTKKTFGKSRVPPVDMAVNARGVWTTPLLKGLRKGTLHVEAAAFDYSYNLGIAPEVNRVLR